MLRNISASSNLPDKNGIWRDAEKNKTGSEDKIMPQRLNPYEKVAQLFAPRIRELVDYSRSIENIETESFALTRPLLTFIKAKSEQAEELLDAYGARTNTRWFPMRENIALLKNFSNAGYELIHILHSCQFYDLGNSYNDFFQATQSYVSVLENLLKRSLKTFLENADKLKLTLEPRPFCQDFSENIEKVRLPRDRRPQGPESIGNRINTLAISVLNTTEDVKNFRAIAKAEVRDWDKLDFDFLCETKLRSLEVNMHVLQSMYDTYISDGDTEGTDADLLRLRGRITAALHLLRIATICIHFYERHMRNKPQCPANPDECSRDCNGSLCINETQFYDTIQKYLAAYIAQFLTEGREICTRLIRTYCVKKTVTVKTPPYIGFHVRPSTLVFFIAQHYGGDVKMILGDSEYDASSPLNIIMANNYLNQKKRAFILEKLCSIDMSDQEEQLRNNKIDKAEAARQVILKLAALGYIKIYHFPLKFDNVPDKEGDPLWLSIFTVIKFLMENDRQVGIIYNATVDFTGPEQAVDDIAALADANYCESERGEDLPLPHQLDYLNFKRGTAVKTSK